MQKKEHVLCGLQEKERRLKVQYDNASRDLKHEKEEVEFDLGRIVYSYNSNGIRTQAKRLIRRYEN